MYGAMAANLSWLPACLLRLVVISNELLEFGLCESFLVLLAFHSQMTRRVQWITVRLQGLRVEGTLALGDVRNGAVSRIQSTPQSKAMLLRSHVACDLRILRPARIEMVMREILRCIHATPLANLQATAGNQIVIRSTGWRHAGEARAELGGEGCRIAVGVAIFTRGALECAVTVAQRQGGNAVCAAPNARRLRASVR